MIFKIIGKIKSYWNIYVHSSIIKQNCDTSSFQKATTSIIKGLNKFSVLINIPNFDFRP